MKIPKAKQLPSGKWHIGIMIDGQRYSITEATEAAATAKAVALKAGIAEKAKEEERKRQQITLGAAIEEYIATYGPALSPSTVRGYDQIHRNNFLELQKKKIKDITIADIQRAINAESNAAPKTLKNRVALVSAVLRDHGIELRYKRLLYPHRAPAEHPYLEGDEIVALFTAIEGDIAEIPILLALWLGLRRSEIMGLRWEGVDFERHQLHIDHAVVFDRDNKIVEKDWMKNETSSRTIDCPEYIMGKLREICPESRSGPVITIHPNTPYDRLKTICTAAGITFPGLHGLRHTNASVMLSLGVLDKIAMARGGWSTDFTLKRAYQHLFKQDVTTAAQQIDGYFTDKLHTKLQTEEAVS